MNIRKALWYGNAISPVMLMIDDLTNAWIDLNGNGKVDPEEDWGYAMDSPGSAFAFLTGEILRDYQEIKVTFFVPLCRAPETMDHGYRIHFGAINESESLVRFFRSIHEHNRYEVAYHGISHGICKTRGTEFIQEWLSYKDIDEALLTISKGKELFKEVMGEYPKGGKYCGYQKNEFSDESIDRSGFLWWCRTCSGMTVDNGPNPGSEMGFFGDNNVVDVPTTVNGALFNFYKRPFYINIIKSLLGRKIERKPDVIARGRNYIDLLLSGRKLISIQEHISPSRTDGKIQKPNIFDDKESLLEILSYLKGKNVWYATGTEVTAYFKAYNTTAIDSINQSEFKIHYQGNISDSAFISLILEGVESVSAVRLPDGRLLKDSILPSGRNTFIINNFPLINGTCTIVC